MAEIPAATILLVRDAPGLEVLMVVRQHEIDFAAGALVFPGGKVAADDFDPNWAARVDGAEALAETEIAFRIAAIREAYEESGVLLARRDAARGRGRALADGAACAALAPARAAVARSEASFLALIAEAGLALALDALTPFAHWITPQGMPKRFDTRFYVAVAPDAQIAACDGRETIDAIWMAPGAAVEDGRENRRKIIFPTRLNLELLAEAQHAADAVARAQARRIVTVEPKIVKEGEALILTIPAEAGYSVTREPLAPNMP
jgi:8-oxo-dGTP pyrophosphatase MutT (NUDIX family)